MHYLHTTSARLRQRGFTLVEIMVAITLSLIVLAGVLAVMYSSKVTYMENERVARIQESGRAAMELMLRDLRGAGFPGCAQPIAGLFDMNNLLNDNDTVQWNLTQPTFGYEAGDSSWTPTLDATLFPDATPGNDVLVVRTIPAGSPSMRVTAAVGPTADITVIKGRGEELIPGTPAIISDCANATIFVVGDFTADGDDTGADITREANVGTPSNSTTNLGATFEPGARVAPITSVAYYVATSASGTGTSLWRVRADNPPEELVPNVEALQVRYGLNTNNDTGVTIDTYVDADGVTDWSQVVSVSLAMLVRSAEANAKIMDERTYQLLEESVGPFDDFFQRSLFTTTVTLRNRTT